jgi:hypothetical protein
VLLLFQHLLQQYSYFGIGIDRFDSTAQPYHIIINFIDATTISGWDPVPPCGQPGAFKCNPEAIAGSKVIWFTYLLMNITISYDNIVYKSDAQL